MPEEDALSGTVDHMKGIIPVGTRVLMMPPHPWAGHFGVIDRWEVIGIFADEGPKPVIKLDDGHECFAMRANQFGIIPAEKRKRRSHL
jgi:hypothetical protein